MAKRYYDEAMIHEDDSKHSSMPTEAVMKDFPEAGGYMPGQNDSLSGLKAIDNQIAGDTVHSVKPRKA